ncbi:13555_t:CDS:2, partial [Ambispora gerdemannii]
MATLFLLTLAGVEKVKAGQAFKNCLAYERNDTTSYNLLLSYLSFPSDNNKITELCCDTRTIGNTNITTNITNGLGNCTTGYNADLDSVANYIANVPVSNFTGINHSYAYYKCPSGTTFPGSITATGSSSGSFSSPTNFILPSSNTPISSADNNNPNLVPILVPVSTTVGVVAVGGITYYLIKKRKKTQQAKHGEHEVITALFQGETNNKAIELSNVQQKGAGSHEIVSLSPQQIQQLQAENARLSQQLAQNASKKVKYSVQLSELENQLKNLPQQNISEQEKTIQQLEQEIKVINQELGISEEPKEKKPNLPNSTYQDLLDDLKTIDDELTKSISELESNPPNPSY